MPLYEYRCADCGAVFEELIGGKKEIINCPTCGENNCEKLISSFAVPGGPGNGTCPTSCQKRSCGTCG